jgi:MarR family transcriptional regulator, organic hydroperoxide resistance regulator
MNSPRRASPTASTQQATADWLALDQQLCFALYSTSLAMTKLYKPLLSPLGLTYPQYLALLVLWERDGLGVGELGERLFLDSGTLTPLLKRMEAAGWLKRERDSADERRVVVKLTADGRALRTKAKRVPVQLGQGMQCGLDEVTSLTQRLQQLRANLLDATAGDAAAAH